MTGSDSISDPAARARLELCVLNFAWLGLLESAGNPEASGMTQKEFYRMRAFIDARKARTLRELEIEEEIDRLKGRRVVG